uniref:C-type lectin domain-containing protein n=1 Tax=Acrobeloides nanus TaxID=290746 RepID=A0A914EE71_9BILA
MCIRCPMSCSLCVICNQTKPAKPVVWNCRGINLTYEGKSYCLITDATNFDNAESICQGNGTSLDTQGHISSVKSAFVNSYFLNVMKQNNIAEIWIGSGSILNSFYYNFDIWLDGTPLQDADPTYVPSYLSLKSDGMWYSHLRQEIVKYKDATTTLPYICQAPVKYIST